MGNSGNKKLTEKLFEYEKKCKKWDLFSENPPWTLSQAEQQRIDNTIANFPFPSNIAGLVKKPFAESAYLKGHDWVTLLGSLGSYVIGDFMDEKYRTWFQKMFSCIERCTAVSHSHVALDFLQSQIDEVLAEMEILFPRYVNTINFHVLHHVAEHIRDVGAVPFNWSYGYERFYGALLKFKKV